MAARASHHNRVLEKAYERARRLEGKLARAVEPVLLEAADHAARNFERLAVEHGAMTAAGRRCDRVSGAVPSGARGGQPMKAGGGAPPGAGGETSRASANLVAAVEPGSLKAMVALKPRPDEAAAIALDGGEEAWTLHQTLAFLGEVEGPLEPVLDVLRPVAAAHPALAGTVGGAGAFHVGDGPHPQILLPDVPGLAELRVAVTEALHRAGLDYSREHGFAPHVTVGYQDAPTAPPGPPYGLPLHFDGLWVVRGDREAHELPLLGQAPALTAGAPCPCGSPLRDEPYEGQLICGNGHGHLRRPPRGLTAAASGGFCLPAELRTKTDPVRLAVIETVGKAAVEGAGVAWDVTNPLISKALTRTASQITHIAQTTQLDVMRTIRASYDEGLSIPDTAKAIQAVMRDAAPARARLIARTELAGAVNGASLAATQVVAEETGAAYSKVWMTAPGAPNPRHETYEGLDGQERPLEAPFDVDGSDLMYPGDPSGPPDEVCNCVAGGAEVDLPGLRAAMRRWYAGELVHVRFAGGGELAVTPNHPVLTRLGWKRAGDLEQGDHCVGGRVVRHLVGEPDEQAVPAEVGEVYRAARIAAEPWRVRLRPHDLHGDVPADGEVEVVPVDGRLPLESDAAGGEQFAELGLALSEAAALALCGAHDPALEARIPVRITLPRPAGLVRGERQRAPLLDGELRHPDHVRGGAVATLDPALAQPAVDHRAGDAEPAGDGEDALACDVSLHEVVEIEVDPSWAGWVYNFDTGHGFYFTGSGVRIACGNCRCTISFVDRGGNEADGGGEADLTASAGPLVIRVPASVDLGRACRYVDPFERDLDRALTRPMPPLDQVAALQSLTAAAGPAGWSAPAASEVLDVSCEAPHAALGPIAAKPEQSPEARALERRASAYADAPFYRGQAAHDIARAAGLDEAKVKSALDDWEFGWRPQDPQFVGFQIAAAGLSGLDESAIAGRIGADAFAAGKQAYEADRGFYDGLVRAMYDKTQASLAAEGIETVKLFRAAPPGADTAPASSWTPDRSIAELFKGVYEGQAGPVEIVEQGVPASRILSTSRTGFGDAANYEYVVLRDAAAADLPVAGAARPWEHLKDSSLKSHISHARTDLNRATGQAERDRLTAKIEGLQRELGIRQGTVAEPRPWQHLKDTTLKSHISHAKGDLRKAADPAERARLEAKLADLERELELRDGQVMRTTVEKPPPPEARPWEHLKDSTLKSHISHARTDLRRTADGGEKDRLRAKLAQLERELELRGTDVPPKARDVDVQERVRRGFDELSAAPDPARPTPFEALQRHARQDRLKEGVLYRTEAGRTHLFGADFSRYTAKAGYTAKVGDTVVFVEDGGALPAAHAVDAFRRQFDGIRSKMSPAQAARLRTVDVFKGRNPGDKWFSQQYRRPGFRAAATAGNGEVHYWGDSAFNLQDPAGHNILAHEVGHIVGVYNGPPEDEAWRAAQDLDKKWNAPGAGALWKVEDGVGRYENDLLYTSRAPRFGRETVSDYAATNVKEEWAESVRLYLENALHDPGSMQFGTIRDPATGFLRPAKFADVYPNRARIIERQLAPGD